MRNRIINKNFLTLDKGIDVGKCRRSHSCFVNKSLLSSIIVSTKLYTKPYYLNPKGLSSQCPKLGLRLQAP